VWYMSAMLCLLGRALETGDRDVGEYIPFGVLS
jgi:hypothetical protein